MNKTETEVGTADGLVRFDLVLATDLKDGSQVKASRRVELTETQAIFHKGAKVEYVEEFLKLLRTMDGCSRLWGSDAFDYLAREFGTESVADIAQRLQYSDAQLSDYALISVVPPQHRHNKLDAGHYAVIGAAVHAGQLPKENITTWIRLAVEAQLNYAELAESIKEGKVTKQQQALSLGGGSTTNRTSLIAIQSVGTTITRWLKQIETRGCPFQTMAPEQKEQVYKELHPALDIVLDDEHLRTKLEAELAARKGGVA